MLSVLAGGRRRIVEVGTAYGYSTLWMALGQPADGTIVTIDPDAERTDLARGWWREAGIPDERITVVTAKALEAFADGDPALAGPFDLAFIDALKPEYGAYLDALIDGRLAPGALVVADNVLWSGRVVRCDAGRDDDRNTDALRAFCERVLGDRGSPRRSCRSATACSSPRGAGDRPPGVRIRVRLFAIQRELAGTREVALELPDGATVADAWAALVALHPGPRAGRDSVRFARNGDYADATTPLADGDEVAMIPPVSRRWRRRAGPHPGAPRRPVRRGDPRRARRPARHARGRRASSGSSGGTRITPGTPAPGQEAEAARHAGRAVEALEYEAHEPMAIGDPRGDRRRDRGPVRRRAARDRPSDRRGAARRGLGRGRRRAPASRRGVRRRALRDRRDEGAGPDLEGRALRRRPRLDRRAGTDRRRTGGGRVRVYISVDMEGIAGVSHPDPTDPSDRRYPVAVDLMVGETNAAIEGALAGGATDILVNDSHWNMYNLLPADLHPAARVLQGQKAWSMVAGAMPGAGWGAGIRRRPVRRLPRPGRSSARHDRPHLLGQPVETRLDGRPTGEYGLNALVLGAWGIPVGLVAGDDALAEEVETWLPWAERVVVKTADGGRSAISVHPTRRARTRPSRRRASGAARGRRRAADRSRSGRRSSSRSTTRRASWPTTRAIVPGAERVGDRTVRFVADDPVTAYRGFLAITGWPAVVLSPARSVPT